MAKCTSQGYVNRKDESRGIWRIKGWRLWMSQSFFSLGFLSQNSLWKLSTFLWYKGILVGCMRNVKSQFQPNRAFWRLELAIRTSHEFEPWANCLVRLEVLSYNATIGVTFQLPLHALHVCHSSDLPVMRSNCKTPLNCTLLEISSHSLTHYPYIIPTYIHGI